ncbi:MAG: energy transducer TonB [Candidatus Acidiferrum sp.]
MNHKCAESWTVSAKAFYNLPFGHLSIRPLEECEVRVKVTKLVAVLGGVCTLLLFLAISEAQEKKTAVSPGMSGVYQILTPTGGVDFSKYMEDVLVRVKRNWFSVMPDDAQLGKKGRVVVRFQIQKDGTLLIKEPTVEVSSKDAQLDKAAAAAVRTSAPFKPLPDAFQGPSIDLRFLFLYNVPYNMPPQNSGPLSPLKI